MDETLKAILPEGTEEELEGKGILYLSECPRCRQSASRDGRERRGVKARLAASLRAGAHQYLTQDA